MSYYDARRRFSRRNNVGEKRKGESAVPVNLREVLNQNQISALRQMESFGWQLAFIRRNDASEPLAIVERADKSGYGVLELDGSITTSFDLHIRHKA